MTTNAPAPRRGGRRTDTPAGKVLAAGLAGATCIGLVGVIGIRSAADAAAKPANADPAVSDALPAEVPQPGSGNLSQAQLDEYAAQLAAERQRLVDYRSYLVDVAGQLQTMADGSGAVVTQASATTGKKKPKAVPQPKPQKQAKQQAHAQTEGS